MKTTPLYLLIAEDEAAHIEAIRRAFERAGVNMDIRAVSTLSEYRANAVARMPDIGVVDLNLPDGKALEVLTHPPEDAPFPVVVMTAFGNQEIVVEVMKAGALEYVVKSVEAFASMPHTVERVLREWRLLQKHKQLNEALERNEVKHERMVANIGDVIVIIDQDGINRYKSPNIERLFGWRPEEVVGAAALANVHPDDLDHARDFLGALFREPNATGRIDCRYRCKDGSYKWIEFNGVNLVHDPAIHGLLGNYHDITERKLAEEALRKSEGFLQQAQHIANLGSYVLDIRGGRWSSSDVLDEVFGIDKAYGRSVDGWLALIHPDDRSMMADYFETDVIGRHQPFDKEYRIIRQHDHAERWVHGMGRLKYDAQGHPVEMAGTIQDITERKHVDAYRDMARDVLQILNESGVPDYMQRVIGVLKTQTGFDAVGMRLQDGEDYPYLCQQGFSKDFLLTENTLIERGADGGVCRDKDGYACLECTCGLVISGKTDPSSPLFTRGGSFWTNDSFPLLDLPSDQDPRLHPRNTCIHKGYASFALVPIRSKDKIEGLIHLSDRRKGCFTRETIELLEGIAAHIGAALMRKHAEQALMESKALFESVVENAPLMIFLKDATDLRFVVFNHAGEELLGYDRKALLGRNNLDLFPAEQAANFMAKDREALAGLGVVDIPEEAIMTAKKGERLLHTRKICVRGSDGMTKYLLGISEDITERKHAEMALQKSHDELEQRVEERTKELSVAKLAAESANQAKSSFLSCMSHELRTPLNAVIGFSQMLDEQIFGPLNPKQAEYVKDINESGALLLDLINDVLDLSKVDAGKMDLELSAFPISDLIDSSLMIVREKAAVSGVKLISAIPPELLEFRVSADARRLKQVMFNLVSNAVKFTPKGGEIRITAERRPDAIVISIADTGMGISTTEQERIFDEFYQVPNQEDGKPKGTGLGLGLARRFVAMHGGKIWVTSAGLGKGSKFSFSIPVEVKPTPGPHGVATVLGICSNGRNDLATPRQNQRQTRRS